MAATTGPVRTVADDYVHAWLAGDVEKALSFVADDIVCQAPGGRLEGLQAYREFLAPFATSIARGELVDLLVDDTHAITVYTVDLPFAKDYHGVERLTIVDGKITHAISVFDLAPVIKAGAYPQG